MLNDVSFGFKYGLVLFWQRDGWIIFKCQVDMIDCFFVENCFLQLMMFYGVLV